MKILIISDVHANLEALEAILNKETYNYLIFLGDVLDYGPSPSECLKILKEKSDIFLLGNHDSAVAYGIDCGCGYEFKELSVETRLGYTVKNLEKDDIVFLKTLSPKKAFYLEGLKFKCYHATPIDPLYQYLKPSFEREEFIKNFKASFNDAYSEPKSYIKSEFNLFSFNKTSLDEDRKKEKPDFILLGHTHIPFFKNIEGTIFLNPGSAGQPRDFTPSASYGVLEEGEYYLKRIPYDFKKIIDKIDKMGLKASTIETLKSIIIDGGKR